MKSPSSWEPTLCWANHGSVLPTKSKSNGWDPLWFSLFLHIYAKPRTNTDWHFCGFSVVRRVETTSALNYHISMWKVSFKVCLKQKTDCSNDAHWQAFKLPTGQCACNEFTSSFRQLSLRANDLNWKETNRKISGQMSECSNHFLLSVQLTHWFPMLYQASKASVIVVHGSTSVCWQKWGCTIWER